MNTEARSPAFNYQFNENDQEFSLFGSFRPQKIDELADCINSLEASISNVTGNFYLNVKRLVRMNNVAFHAIAKRIVKTSGDRPDLKIHVTTSSVLGWSTRKFSTLAKIAPNITINEYDNEFYPGQSFLEDGGFIPILRTQTKLTWRHEKSILPRHGLKPGMHVADICCGIGDFAVLMQKEFQPGRLIALDHSKSSLNYARKVAEDFGVRGIEYVYGDASEMLLEDNQFDFVTCRHSLQVFDRPDLILKELYRICKPGGRVYITNEKNSHCLGEPRSETIQRTYNEVARLWDHFNMDIELGPKSRRYLLEAGFSDISIESFMVTNLDGNPQDFADIIQSWKDVYAGQMAVERGDSVEDIKILKQGFQDHIFAALHPKGYAGWPIWAASGQKPQ
ncbi:methyltransferase domain-containing protein [Roseibium polysiphoniae]|uniref:Methyltransferase domain-containing protein n=1 Tax=Roseibium polysiphoniae TaxID=2571221 RepID=A0A944CGS2_9HYPH|nr:class I SAM-dependent methyltransferase [Roseibium polysiphoniae]MBS8262588.1 methyltransferase domain-containing protein [Roseibium polysiphoniae]